LIRAQREMTPAGVNESYKDKVDRLHAQEKQKGSGAIPHEEQLLNEEVQKQLMGAGDKKKRILNSMLYTDQIDNMMSIYPEFLGTVARDQIKDIIPKIKPHTRGGFVMNTDPSSKGGQHWVAVFFDGRPNGSHSIEYFDSYGEEPPLEILAELEKIKDKLKVTYPMKLKVNQIKQQRANSFTCGYHSIGFLKDRFQGKRFREVTKFDDSRQGEKNAKNLAKKYKLFHTIK
jgi:hypothetical protein